MVLWMSEWAQQPALSSIPVSTHLAGLEALHKFWSQNHSTQNEIINHIELSDVAIVINDGCPSKSSHFAWQT